MLVWILASVFLIPNLSQYLLFELQWEETLQLVGELCAHVNVELGAVEFLVALADVNQFEFQLNVACEQHKWLLAVADVRVLELMEA